MSDKRPCGDWTPADGGARWWCDRCGVRADLHPGSGPTGEACARIVGTAA